MVIGDIFDRGKDVPQIFWLFYKLEDEAAKAGGTVSFLLGNHEPLVLANDLLYTKDKYKVLAQKLNMDYPIALQQANNTIQPTMRVGHNKHFLRLPILPIGAFHRMQFHIKWKSAFMIYHMQGKIFG